jgi:hypothetical protein
MLRCPSGGFRFGKILHCPSGGFRFAKILHCPSGGFRFAKILHCPSGGFRFAKIICSPIIATLWGNESGSSITLNSTLIMNRCFMRWFIRLVLLTLGSLPPTSGEAATDGSLGPNSTGSKSVSIAIPAIIRISGMNDFVFSNYAGSGSSEITNSIVIGGNFSSGGGTYRVTALGSGRQNAFTVESTTLPSQLLSYTVLYNDSAGRSGAVQVSRRAPLTNQSGAHSNLNTTTPNASLTILFGEPAFRRASAGLYTGTLSVIVEPE